MPKHHSQRAQQTNFISIYGLTMFAWILWLCLPTLARADQLFKESGNPASGPALIFIHGWTNKSDKWNGPIAALKQSQPNLMKKYQVYRYEYEWSQPIEVSGLNLNHEIERVLQPRQPLVIVAHSMGGLVARSALENYTGQTADLRNRLLQLITLDTPHHGSPFANIAWLQQDSKIKRADAALFFSQNFSEMPQYGIPQGPLVNLNNDGGYGLGWDNNDGQMPNVVWNGSQNQIKGTDEVPRASRFTALLNARANLTSADIQSLTAKYSAVGSYHSYLPDLEWGATLLLLKDGKSDLAGRTALGRFYQNSDDPSGKIWPRRQTRWVDNYVANDGVVPLSSSLFLDDGAKTGRVDKELVYVDVNREIAPFHRRIGAIKVVQNVEHSAVTDNAEVLKFVAQRLSQALVVGPTAPIFGQRIAFVSERDGNREIYIMDENGASVKRLTSNNATDWQPCFSPDGDRIAFASERTGSLDIWTMDESGAQLRRLTTSSAHDSAPTWSADGRSIAFVSERDGNAEIYLMDADGGNQRRLTNDNATDGAPSFSSDGQFVAFESARDNTYSYDIRVVNVRTGASRLATHSRTLDWRAAWRPNGSDIAFASRDGNANKGDGVWVVPAQGGVARRISPASAEEWDPAWSVDGTRLACASNVGGSLQIVTMNADGTNRRQLTRSDGKNYQPAWGRATN